MLYVILALRIHKWLFIHVIYFALQSISMRVFDVIWRFHTFSYMIFMDVPHAMKVHTYTQTHPMLVYYTSINRCSNQRSTTQLCIVHTFIWCTDVYTSHFFLFNALKITHTFICLEYVVSRNESHVLFSFKNKRYILLREANQLLILIYLYICLVELN